MSRLLSRFGMRAIAIGLLVLGLTGGYLLSSDRQTQHKNVMAGDAAMAEADEMHELKIIQAESWRLSAPQRAAQADAQAKADAAAQLAASRAKAADDAARVSRSKPRTTVTTAPPYKVPSSCSQYSGNQGIGCGLLLDSGFGLDQMPCLVNIWNKESGWRTTAENASGAYGIPQAYPASKMSVFGADYRTNPVTQIKWGLSYIKGRYQSPCGAWSYWQAHHSY